MKKAAALFMALCLSVQVICASPGMISAADFSDTEVFTGESQESEGDSGIQDAQEEGGNQDAGADVEIFENPQTDEVKPEEQLQSQEGPTQDTLFGDGTEEAEDIFTDLASGETAPGKASLKVELRSAVSMAKERSFMVKLGNEEREVSLSPSAEGAVPSIPVYFTDVDPGAYTLTIKSKGFTAYTQQLEMKDMDYQLQVYTGQLAGTIYDAAGHPGAMLIGDVNGDDKVDSSDKEVILKAINEASYRAEADLNLDGVVDLMDLHYFAKGMTQGNTYLSSVLESVPVRAALKAGGDSTEVSGNLDSLGSDEGVVALERTDNAVISDAAPVSVNFDFSNKDIESVSMAGITLESPAENAVTSGKVELELADGAPIEGSFSVNPEKAVFYLMESAAYPTIGATVDQDGTIVIDFGKQVVIKKVTIKITGTKKLESTLAEVSKVTFVNDMEDRIAPPKMDIPENLAAAPGNKQFTLTWEKADNITGYEVEISCDGKTEVKKTSATTLKVSQFLNNKIENRQTFKVRVQSVNGEWRSGYCAEQQVTPMADKKPDAPDNLKVTGGYKSISAAWKNMKDTDSYHLYYKKDSETAFHVIPNIPSSSYVISDLESYTKYQVYVTGVNELGESGPSLTSSAMTISLEDVKAPAYKLINTSMGIGKLSSHIVKITRGRGIMKDSPLDENQGNTSANGVADNNFASSYHVDDWDDGASYPSNDKGVTVLLDAFYDLGSFSIVDITNTGYIGNYRIVYLDKDGTQKTVANPSVMKKQDAKGKYYYYVKLNERIYTNKIQIMFGRGNGYTRSIDISELYLYAYDSLEKDMIELYKDDLHTALKEEVTEETLQGLQDRLDTPDEVSGEYHPEKEMLQKELDTAKEILKANLKATVSVHGEIRNKDGYLGFGGMNAWQPLGVSARAGEEIVVFAGHGSKKTGTSAEMGLFVVQNHAEAGSFAQQIASLKVGRNEVVIPSLQSIDVEKGGQLYVQYTGGQDGVQYGVRVNGGVSVPKLDLYGLSGDARRAAILAYVTELEEFVPTLEKKHQEAHQKTDYTSVNYAYDEKNCILNTTDIMLNQMMYSVPASQILNGLGSGTAEEKADKLETALKSMDDMLTLFFQHKGLTNAPKTPDKNKLPSQHLNIRYMIMFAGAFMYASGNHVGIEWGSVTGLMSQNPVVSDENGRYVSGHYFGWGIAHEIGHEINQGTYAIAEITNNYFSVLAQAQETNSSVRFKYEDVYEKVTSGAAGRADNVFVQLAMYWQLHLAYDRGYNFKTYDTYNEIFKNLFFARVDSYARDISNAPKPGGVALTLSGDTDQKLMRLACAAAERDLTEFFERWGMIPNEETLKYMSQFGKEERAIYYVNDEARAYEIENGTGSTFKGQDTVSASVSAEGTKVQLKMQVKQENQAALLGYEIYRCTNAKGVIKRDLAGFTTTGSYTDLAISAANRVVTYEVTAVDKFLNRSEAVKLEPVKIDSDGRYAKAGWTVTTSKSITSKDDTIPEYDEENPDSNMGANQDADKKILTTDRMLDDSRATTYHGTASGAGEIILDFHKTLAATALVYEAEKASAIQRYKILLSEDGGNWFPVKEGTFQLDETGKAVVYFENERQDPWVSTYDVRYLKLQILDAGEFSVTELEILGPSGDNVEFVEDGIGVLKSDYTIDAEMGEIIPKGSIIFTGSYKGNPAYNVVVLYDENGDVVGHVDKDGNLKSNQVIFAEVPENGKLGEISSGSWVYYITPEELEDIKNDLPKSVRAELYRVDKATTNEGERLVSDTAYKELPPVLPIIAIK